MEATVSLKAKFYLQGSPSPVGLMVKMEKFLSLHYVSQPWNALKPGCFPTETGSFTLRVFGNLFSHGFADV